MQRYWKSGIVFVKFIFDGEINISIYLQQDKLFSLLKDFNKGLYENLDSNLRTLYLLLTGDNYRAAAKSPTEQISFSLLNNVGMLHSPYGQFIASLWGSESRLKVKINVSDN